MVRTDSPVFVCEIYAFLTIDIPVFLGARSIFEIEKIAGRGDTEVQHSTRLLLSPVEWNEGCWGV